MQALKQAFMNAPVRVLFHPKYDTRIHTDSSDHTTGAVLSQLREDNKWHPVAFDSKKLNDAERNYHIHDKELLAIVRAARKWRHYLLSLEKTPTVITDHKNLEYFSTKRDLSGRQMRWSEFLSEIPFKLVYDKGENNVVADALSRRDDAVDIPRTQAAIFPLQQRRAVVGHVE